MSEAFWGRQEAAIHAQELERQVSELGSGMPRRTWTLCEGGHAYATTQASSAEEALQAARDGVDAANYDVQRTVWIGVAVRCDETGESDTDTVALDPDEPRCADAGDHDWDAPHDIVGGLKENPGVFGHGGGIVSTEVCLRCGCSRVTDTWATNPENGVQGLHSVSYEPRKYEREVRARRERETACAD